jgi:hypothetical protein
VGEGQVGLWPVRVQLDGLLEVLDGAVEPLLALVPVAEGEVDLGVGGGKLQGFGELLLRPGVVAAAGGEAGEAEDDVGVVGAGNVPVTLGRRKYRGDGELW